MPGKAWTKEDIIVAYALYCITPFNEMRPKNLILQQIAKIMDRSLSSLILRMQNFRYIDPANNKAGLCHAAKIDYLIFEEFKNDWGNLSSLAEKITGLSLFDCAPDRGAQPISSLNDRNKVSRERHFFRKTVFATYEKRCCISGFSIPEMLIASHIKPYSKCRDTNERITPTNGLLLNTFYDKAFDAGLITITPDYCVRVSEKTKNIKNDTFTKKWLSGIDKQKIILPQRFLPDKKYLEFHNDKVFIR